MGVTMPQSRTDSCTARNRPANLCAHVDEPPLHAPFQFYVYGTLHLSFHAHAVPLRRRVKPPASPRPLAAHSCFMRRRPTIATALCLTGNPGSAWQICTADNAIFEVQFAEASAPVIMRRRSDVGPDRHPRPLDGLNAVNGEPFRFTIAGQRERYEAVVTAITRIRPFCARCGERRLLGACVRCMVDRTHHYAETKWVGKPMSRRRRMFYLLEPVFRFLDGR